MSTSISPEWKCPETPEGSGAYSVLGTGWERKQKDNLYILNKYKHTALSTFIIAVGNIEAQEMFRDFS